jgi:KDO2-lipid IV(A) lauroyltransferase
MSDRGRKTLQRLKNDFVFHAARGVFWLAGRIPLKYGLPLGAALGGFAWRVLRRDRETSRLHLRVAFPEWTEAEREAVGCESFRNLGRSLFELFHFDELLATIDSPAPYVRWIGHEHMDEVMKRGRGGVHVTGHLDNFELMGAWSARRGDMLHEIVRSVYDQRIDRLLNDHRKRFGYIPLSRGGQELVADIAQVFQSNGWLGILMDQDTRVRGVFADWFGRPAWTPSGPAYLCCQAGIDAVVTTIHRDERGGHTIVTSPPLPRPQTGDLKTDVQLYTEMFNRELCNRIRQHPTQWVWMHRRWKTRPPGEAPRKNPAPLPERPHRLVRWAERLLAPAACALSWEAADRLGARLGRAWRRLRPSHAKTVRANLARCFPELDDAARRRLARESFGELGRAWVNLLRHSRMDNRFFAECVTLEGQDRLDAALAQGRGVILATAEWAAGDVALWKLAALGYALHLPARRFKNPRLNDRLVWIRRAHGVESYGEKRAALPVVHALRRNETAAMVLDRPASAGRTVEAKLFGETLAVSSAVARLAARNGCVLLTAHAQRTGPQTWRAVIGEPLAPPENETAAQYTQRVISAIEQTIRQTPEQWLGLHHR